MFERMVYKLWTSQEIFEGMVNKLINWRDIQHKNITNEELSETVINKYFRSIVQSSKTTDDILEKVNHLEHMNILKHTPNTQAYHHTYKLIESFHWFTIVSLSLLQQLSRDTPSTECLKGGGGRVV